ncbi:tumor necrosis factor ligand superfamily member 12 [Tiliqua scincoides]|uniref:tumor necrosis factor ligand superfamily member 12 n=1 Tax=Tiliqua scincoides TaxID=71010 RepID=UPI0034624BD0
MAEEPLAARPETPPPSFPEGSKMAEEPLAARPETPLPSFPEGSCHLSSQKMGAYKERRKRAVFALAGNRTRVNCLEGSYAHHYTTNAAGAELAALPEGQAWRREARPCIPDGVRAHSARSGDRLPLRGEAPLSGPLESSSQPRGGAQDAEVDCPCAGRLLSLDLWRAPASQPATGWGGVQRSPGCQGRLPPRGEAPLLDQPPPCVRQPASQPRLLRSKCRPSQRASSRERRAGVQPRRPAGPLAARGFLRSFPPPLLRRAFPVLRRASASASRRRRRRPGRPRLRPPLRPPARALRCQSRAAASRSCPAMGRRRRPREPPARLLLLALALASGSALLLASLSLLLAAWPRSAARPVQPEAAAMPQELLSADGVDELDPVVLSAGWNSQGKFLHHYAQQGVLRQRRHATKGKRSRPRRTSPVSAAHYEVQSTEARAGIQADENGTIRGWAEAKLNTTSPLRYHSSRGEFTVVKRGLYYLYCQVHFNEGNTGYMKLDVMLDGELALRCLEQFPTTSSGRQEAELRVCQVSGLLLLRPEESIRLRTIAKVQLKADRYLTYFGLFCFSLDASRVSGPLRTLQQAPPQLGPSEAPPETVAAVLVPAGRGRQETGAGQGPTSPRRRAREGCGWGRRLCGPRGRGGCPGVTACHIGDRGIRTGSLCRTLGCSMAGRAASPGPVGSSGLRQAPPRHSPLLAAAWVGGGVVGLGFVACLFMVVCIQCRLEGLHVELEQLREELLFRGHGAAGDRGAPKEHQRTSSLLVPLTLRGKAPIYPERRKKRDAERSPQEHPRHRRKHSVLHLVPLRHASNDEGDATEIWWTASLKHGRALELSGRVVVVKHTGLYFIYSQVLFHDPTFTMGQVLQRQVPGRPDEILFCCVQSMPADPEQAYNSCYSGGIFHLQHGDHLTLRIPRFNASFDARPHGTFLGLLRL